MTELPGRKSVPGRTAVKARLRRSRLGRGVRHLRRFGLWRVAILGCIQAERLDIALALWRSKAGRGDQDHVASGELVMALLDAGRFDDVEEVAGAVLRSVPENASPDPWIQFNLARSLQAQGKLGEALRWFLQAARSPHCVRLVTELVTSPPFKSLRKTAIEQLSELQHASSPEAPERFLLGTLLLDVGDSSGGRILQESYRAGWDVRTKDLPPAAWSGSAGRLPHFLILGPPKTGTTSLFHWLSAHPRIVGPPRKELMVWAKPSVSTPELYRSYFPSLADDAGILTGEATPYQLFARQAAEYFGVHRPQLRAVVLRRDPVALAHSCHQMRLGTGRVTDSFEQVARETLRQFPDQESFAVHAKSDILGNPFGFAFIAEAIEIWMDQLESGSLVVVQPNMLSETPERLCRAVQRHIGIDEDVHADLQPWNVNTYSRLDPGLARELAAMYSPHERQLDALIAQHQLGLIV